MQHDEVHYEVYSSSIKFKNHLSTLSCKQDFELKLVDYCEFA